MHGLEDIRARLAAIPDPIALLEGLFAHAPVAFQIYEASGRCLLTNRAFRDLFGAEPPPEYNVLVDEIAKKSGILDLIHRAFAGESVSLPAVWYDPKELQQVKVEHGHRVAIESTFFPLRDKDGKVTHVAIAFKDVTEEHLARSRAESDRATLSAVLDQMPVAILIADACTGAIFIANRRARELLGPIPLPESFDEYTTRIPLERNGRAVPLEQYTLVRAARNGQTIHNEELELVRDGRRVPFRVSAAPVRDQDGQVLSAVVALEDVSVETEARNSAREMVTRLEDANRQKDEFLAIVSHELRTPLNAILGWSALLRAKEFAPPELDRAVETIERNARAQARLIDDVLDVSRIVSGKLQLDVSVVDLGAAVRAAVDVVKPAADAKGIRMDVMIVPPEIKLLGDGDRLQQIVWNLLSNAVKFTGNGGNVLLRVTEEDHTARIVVKDTGSGIAPDLLPHVFERFRQADTSSTREHGGLGLGLSIVRHLVELHGGTARAESDGDGKGTTFTITLPIPVLEAEAEETAESPTERLRRSARTRLSKKRVLVVEDDRDARELMMVLLAEEGADVCGAGSVAQALARLHEFSPQIVVTDLAMPEQDGFDLLRELRGRGIAVPAVAVTAYASAEDRERCLRAGFARHLGKPIEPIELLDAVYELTG